MRIAAIVVTTLGTLVAGPRAQSLIETAIVIEHVNVLPMTSDVVLRDRTVLIRGGIITRIDGPDSEIPIRVTRIDGRGQYLLPGLVDLHVHVFGEGDLAWYLAYGVTTVRNMWGSKQSLAMQAAIEQGKLVGPTLITAGAILGGYPPRLRGSVAIRSPKQGEEEVSRQAAAGYDFIKIYDQLDVDSYRAIIAAGKRLTVPVVGHVPKKVGLLAALDSGQASLEHLRGFPSVVMATDSGANLSWDSTLEPQRLAEAVKAAGRSSAAIVPTLVILEALELDAAEQRSFLRRPEAARLPQPLKRFSCRPAGDAKDDLSQDSRKRRSANRAAVVRALHRAGARVLAGSDTGNQFVLPGESLHDELSLLHSCGLTPYEVIRAATFDASRFLELEDTQGTIEIGKRADLVLVKLDPRSNLHTLRRPVGVVSQGRWLPATQLDRSIGKRSNGRYEHLQKR